MDFDRKRKAMVHDDLYQRKIRSKRVLEAFLKIPRHLFVPDSWVHESYHDYPLPIGENQTISQPYIVALMTEALSVQSHHTVLEIGTGSGYQTAILSRLAQTVYTLDIYKSLQNEAKRVHEQLGLTNILYALKNGYQGWVDYAPYDRIIVTAAPKTLPMTLIEQLKMGGIMIAPIGDSWMQELVKITKTDDGYRKEFLGHCRFVEMQR